MQGSVIVLETGWGGAAPLFEWYLKGLTKITRVCTLYNGMGWSSLQPNYGFRDDAEGIEAVLHSEFKAAGLLRDGPRRIAVVGGRSRVLITANAFKEMYAEKYNLEY